MENTMNPKDNNIIKLSNTSVDEHQEGPNKEGMEKTIDHVHHTIENNANQKHIFGVTLTLLSAITFSFNALVAKLLNHFHPFNLGFWSFQIMTYISILCIIIKKFRHSELPIFTYGSGFIPGGENLKKAMCLWLRALFGVCALTLFFYSMSYIQVGDALLIDSTSPIFVYIMAFLCLGEKCGILPVFNTIFAMIGIILITRPPILTGATEYNFDYLIGSTLAFGCMICITLAIIVLKFLKDVPQEIINLVLCIWGTFQCLILTIVLDVFKVPDDFGVILKIVATAVLFFLGQTFITIALKFLDAGSVGLLRTTEVVFAFVWQFIFLGVYPDLYSLLGSILILLGVFLTVLRTRIGSLPLTDSRRKVLSCLNF